LLGVLALGELVLLRTGTRTLVHIPGLGRYETPIRILAEVGRFAYYLAVVSLVAVLAILAYQGIRTRTLRRVTGGVGALVFLAVAGAGRVEILAAPVVGWTSLVLLIVVTAAVWRGLRTLPIGLFVLGWAAAGWTVLGQGAMGGLSGRQVDILMLTAEISLLLSAVTAPLLLKGPPPRMAILVGLGVALGVPGWLPGVAYTLALGSIVTTLWSALATGQRVTAIGLLLLIAGGIGTISTYQTGLVLTGVLLLGDAMAGTGWDLTGTIAQIKRTDSLEVMTRSTQAPRLPKSPSPVG
jgi:hypothetical protein